MSENATGYLQARVNYPKLDSFLRIHECESIHVRIPESTLAFSLRSGRKVEVLTTNIFVEKEGDEENFGKVRLAIDAAMVDVTSDLVRDVEDIDLGLMDLSKWNHIGVKMAEELGENLIVLVG